MQIVTCTSDMQWWCALAVFRLVAAPVHSDFTPNVGLPCVHRQDVEPAGHPHTTICPSAATASPPSSNAHVPTRYRVWSRQATYNNDASISGNSLKSAVKVAYYQAFALVYGLCGAFAGERQLLP